MNIKSKFTIKALLLFSIVFQASNTYADIICQRIKAKNPSPRSVLNIKIVKGTKCPAGFVKTGNLISEEEVASLVAQQVNQQLAAISSASLQGPQGEKGDTGATGPQGPQGETGAVGPQVRARGTVALHLPGG